ncbi:PA2169 family four-helix-bundle protein [Brevundimonas sp. A19_0]|uniref:ferritin-like domain-containing protein n=1 Tax=Brevundimonas sp. A19_0 TaxID=2821087 RepID=UPI001ADB473D|nr:PA2169 family four-helix-bundle protein [Brevundimonas sp. A19_0]MBO9501483.1 PA2169 family four-helix-bundle protein [Brevundimonas sp. A19_0]
MARLDISQDPSHDLGVLNRLIEVTRDSAAGYRDAARDSRDPERAAVYGRCADHRTELVDRLRSAAQDLGGAPDEGGTLLGKAHRAFMDVKHALLRDDDTLEGSIRNGEAWLVDTWEAALNDPDLGEPVREVIRSGFEMIDPHPGDREDHLLPPNDQPMAG